jgi:plastocyanin
MRPRRQFLPALLLAAALLAGCADNGGRRVDAAGQPPASGVTDVVAKDVSFTPASIQVPAGTEVTWSFQDGPVPHNVQGDGWAPATRNARGPSATPSTGPAPTTTPAPCTRGCAAAWW